MGSLRVIALGEITGVPGARLDCECGQDDCPKRGSGTDSNGSAETPSDAEDAAAWDDLLPEPADADAPAVELVELVEPVAEPEIPDPMNPPTPEEVPVSFGRALVVPGAPVLTVLKDPDGILVPRLQGYGPSTAITPLLWPRSRRPSITPNPYARLDHSSRRSPTAHRHRRRIRPGTVVTPCRHLGH